MSDLYIFIIKYTGIVPPCIEIALVRNSVKWWKCLDVNWGIGFLHLTRDSLLRVKRALTPPPWSRSERFPPGKPSSPKPFTDAAFVLVPFLYFHQL